MRRLTHCRQEGRAVIADPLAFQPPKMAVDLVGKRGVPRPHRVPRSADARGVPEHQIVAGQQGREPVRHGDRLDATMTAVSTAWSTRLRPLPGGDHGHDGLSPAAMTEPRPEDGGGADSGFIGAVPSREQAGLDGERPKAPRPRYIPLDPLPCRSRNSSVGSATRASCCCGRFSLRPTKTLSELLHSCCTHAAR